MINGELFSFVSGETPGLNENTRREASGENADGVMVAIARENGGVGVVSHQGNFLTLRCANGKILFRYLVRDAEMKPCYGLTIFDNNSEFLSKSKVMDLVATCIDLGIERALPRGR